MHLPVCVYWVCQYWPHPSARHDLSDTLRANTLIPLRKKLTNKNYFYCSGLDVKTIAVGSQQSPTSTHQHHCYKAPILRCTWTRKRESTRGNSTAARRGKKREREREESTEELEELLWEEGRRDGSTQNRSCREYDTDRGTGSYLRHILEIWAAGYALC